MSLLLEALQRSQNKPLALEPAASPAAAGGPELTLAPVPQPAAAEAAPVPPPAPPPAAPMPAAPQASAAPTPTPAPVRQAAAPATGSAAPAAPGMAPMAARAAAQAMVGTAQPPQRDGARVRRMVWGLIAGLVLAVLSWLGWHYWLAQQGPGLTPVGMASPPAPEPAAAQGEVTPPDAAPQPMDEAAVTPGTEAAASVPGVAAVAAAPLPLPAPQAAPAPQPAVPAAPARQGVAPRADRPDAAPQPPAASPSPTPEASGAQPGDASTPEPRRRAASKAAAAAPASPAASAAAATLVRSQAQAQLQAAWTALRQGDAAKAQALYQQVLAERPDDPDATLGLAVALHRQRQHEAAWAAYQRSLQLWPDNDTARTGMLAILSESDPATAESRLQEWVQARPRDAAAQAALGNLLGRQGRWPEALGPLTLAQSLAPGHAAYAYNLAVALDQARRYEDALRMYRQALQWGAAGVPVRTVERRIDELQELWTQ